MTIKFETNRTYQGSYICNHDTKVNVTIAKRTAKMLTTTAGKRHRILMHDDVEFIYPEGSGYSMALRIRADREV